MKEITVAQLNEAFNQFDSLTEVCEIVFNLTKYISVTQIEYDNHYYLYMQVRTLEDLCHVDECAHDKAYSKEECYLLDDKTELTLYIANCVANAAM